MSPVVRGFNVVVNNDQYVTINQQRTGWVKGNSNYIVQVGFDSRLCHGVSVGRRVNYPADFEITFTAKGRETCRSRSPVSPGPEPSERRDQEPDGEQGPRPVHLPAIDNTDSSSMRAMRCSSSMATPPGSRRQHSPQRTQVLVVCTSSRTRPLPLAAAAPAARRRVSGSSRRKPFRTGESFTFTTEAPRFDPSKAKSDLDNIAVVPNPYVGAASWEPATTSVGGAAG